MKYAGVGGKLINEKNLKSESRDTVSLFKYILKGRNYPVRYMVDVRVENESFYVLELAATCLGFASKVGSRVTDFGSR